MLGIIVALLCSWFLLWWFAGRSPDALGWKPVAGRGLEWTVGLLLAAAVCSAWQLMTTAAAGNRWLRNPEAGTRTILSATWWTFKSVVFEELVFRGALLYLAIQRFGAKVACLLSAVCFGVYHWFAYQAWGNPLYMVLVFFMTAIFGLMLAAAFARTRSLYLPLALHTGWNLVNIVVFSNGPLGRQLFVKANTLKPTGGVSLFIFLFQVFALPVLVFLYLRYFYRKRAQHF